MFVRCIGTGSQQGNCYALYDNDGKILLLDLGLARKEILKGIDFNVSDVVGAVVSHGHGDHAKAVKDFESMGIPVFSYKDMKSSLDGKYEEMKHFRYGNFGINAIAMTSKDGEFKHTDNDGAECPCYGFLIEHPDIGKLIYITDTCYVKWTFKNINHIIIGCDYQMKFLMEKYENVEGERIKNHLITGAQRQHILKGHMELQTVKNFVKANKSNALRNVILCHLSRDNTDPAECLAEVQNVVGEGVSVLVAHKGLEAELKESGCPF